MSFLDLNVLFYRLVNIYSFLLDFIKFFFKKDFFFICLISFNDKFEIYVFWKNSFKNIIWGVRCYISGGDWFICEVVWKGFIEMCIIFENFYIKWF